MLPPVVVGLSNINSTHIVAVAVVADVAIVASAVVGTRDVKKRHLMPAVVILLSKPIAIDTYIVVTVVITATRPNVGERVATAVAAADIVATRHIRQRNVPFGYVRNSTQLLPEMSTRVVLPSPPHIATPHATTTTSINGTDKGDTSFVVSGVLRLPAPVLLPVTATIAVSADTVSGV